MKIAIIGTGISGLGAAYLLNPDHQITLYEKEARTGGHSRTIDIQEAGRAQPVDTGFIVFNNWNYPNLLGLFRELDVPYQNSDMSFGVSIGDGWLEYGSGGMFAQARNIARPAYWGMLADIFRFNREAARFIGDDTDVTLQDCLDQLGMGDWFRQYYLLAMGAAIWSCPVDTIMKFPARPFLQFFRNHGLLNLRNRPQWYTVTGGSREYIRRLTDALTDEVRLGYGVECVRRQADQVVVRDSSGHEDRFDQVVLACHADQALAMLDNPTGDERDVLGAFDYQDNRIVVHQDASFMPRRRKCWSSWVYLSEGDDTGKPDVSLTYWMNNLQNFASEKPVLVTLNPGRDAAPDLVHDTHVFRHPVFDRKAIRAQDRIADIQGTDRLWFCGAWQRYGFHEDGLLSAVNVARQMGSAIPWA